MTLLHVPGCLIRLQLDQLIFMRQVRLRCFRVRYVLRNVVFLRSRLAVVVRPAVYRRYFARPVSVLRESRRRPFEGIGLPRVGRRKPAAENAVDKIEQENELGAERQNRRDTYKLIEIRESAKCVEVRKRVIPSGETGDTNVVHREEHQVNPYEGYPEVDVTKSPVHHPPEHFREPVINTRQHSEERRASHHQVEVCHNKVSVVQLDIDRRVSKEYPGDTTCKEERHHTDGEQHRWCEPDVTLPKRGDVVEYLNSRRNCNNQRQQ